MKIQLEIRFTNALALSETFTMDTAKLSAVLDLIIPGESHTALWKNIKHERDVTTGTITLLHLIIIAYCRTGFHKEIERDAAYLLCLKQIIGSNNDELSILFKWYILITKDKFMITG